MYICRYANQHHYNIHPTWLLKQRKFSVQIPKTSTHEDSWNLGETLLQPSDEAVHLGLKRTSKNECEINIWDRLKVARRTKYMLWWGLVYMAQTDWIRKPPIKYIIHMFCSRFLQSLPQRTSIVAIYLLLGALPLQAEYHKKL